jgi:2-methylcitrate dehydratase PrpD
VSETDYLERIGRFVAGTRLQDIPARVLERVKLILADTLPVIAAGMRCPELMALCERQLAGAAPGPAWVIGAGRASNPLDAALLNGIAGAWLDFDEGNFLANGHPGIQVIPSTFAVAQARGLDGASLLAAMALGYEIVARIGQATRMKLIINPHGTYGVVGSALAVGRLTGLAPARFRELASLAASTCMATNRHTMLNGATVRNWYAGHSGYMGQMAARLVESGFTGPADGVHTTFSLVLGDGFSPEVAVDGLGERWLLMEGYLKLYPTARYAHSAIDALFDALRQVPGGRVAPQDVERIDVRAYRLAAFLKNKHPDHWFTTRFSIPFACATLIVGKRGSLQAFSDEAVADPAVQALAAKVEVVEEEAYNAAYPLRQEVALALRLKNGQVYEGRCEVTSGEPGNPHPAGSVEKKYFELADAVWGRAAAQRLLERIMCLETCKDLDTLRENP